MKTNVEISIIVPFFNQEMYLKQCLESIRNQTLTNFEVLMIDDGSCDKSGDIALEYKKIDSRFKYYKNSNHGVAYSRNYGLDNANGKYICFIDSDDCVHKRYLEILKKGVKGSYSVCQCSFKKDIQDKYFLNSECSPIYRNYTVNEAIEMLVDPDNHEFMDYVWNKMYSRDLFEGVRFKDGVYFEDTEIMYKIILKSKSVISTDCELYYYRQNRNSIVHNLDFNKIQNYMTFVNERFDILKSIIDVHVLENALRNSFIFALKSIIKSKPRVKYLNTKSFIVSEQQFFKRNKVKYKKPILYLLTLIKFKIVFLASKIL